MYWTSFGEVILQPRWISSLPRGRSICQCFVTYFPLRCFLVSNCQIKPRSILNPFSFHFRHDAIGRPWMSLLLPIGHTVADIQVSTISQIVMLILMESCSLMHPRRCKTGSDKLNKARCKFRILKDIMTDWWVPIGWLVRPYIQFHSSCDSCGSSCPQGD